MNFAKMIGDGLAGRTLRAARCVIVLLVGSTVLVAGVVMIVTPGPAFIVIPLGLAILGIEFAWARRLLARVRAMATGAAAPSGKPVITGNRLPTPSK